MRITPAFRPAFGVLLAALVVLGTLLMIGRSPVGAADDSTTPAGRPTAPTVKAQIPEKAGPNGWYTGDVTLRWDVSPPNEAAKATYGPDCAEVPPQTGDLPPTDFTCTVTLDSGATIHDSTTIKIDRTAPEVTCPSPAPVYGVGSPPGAQLTATVHDATSGAVEGEVSATLDTSTETPEGTTRTAPVTGTDLAGNTTTRGCQYTVIHDSTPPTVSVLSVTGPTGDDGWYVGDVEVAFTYANPDPETQIVSTTGCNPAPVTEDTAGTPLTCTVVSGGGSASATYIVKRDTTPPVITCPTPPTAVQGNSVTVTAAVSDATSGPSERTSSAVGTAYPLGQHTVSIDARDVAGNTATAQCEYTVVPDPAPPVVTPIVVGPTAADPGSQAQAVGSASVAPWYTGDVTVRFTIEAGSPLISSSGCGPVTITEDTPGVTVTCRATSSGGTTSNSVTIARDATPPTVSCPSPMPTFINGAGGQFTAAFSDATSGVTADSATLDADTGHTGPQTVAVSARDQAGNVVETQCEYRVNPDPTAPEIRVTYSQPLPPSGWYTSPVTISFDVIEDDSPVTQRDGCGPRTIDQDTAGTVIKCTASSFGGQSEEVRTIKLDMVGPTVQCQAVDFVQGAPGRVSAQATDATSGATAEWVFAQANTSTLGERAVTLSATDQAGNVTTVQCSYQVLAAATVTAANLSQTGQDMLPPLLIAGFLIVMCGAALALTLRRRSTIGRHGSPDADAG